MSLKEIASKADLESESQWSSLTVGKLGQIRLKKSAVETPAPKDHEELRQKLKLLGHHFVFLRMMQPNRRELSDVTPFTFTSYADYMLSKRVAKLASEDESGAVFHHPTLKQVLTYDFYLRKKMVETLQPDTPLGKSLKEAMECSVTKERYFTTPLSVSAAAQASTSRSRSPAVPATSSWQGGKVRKDVRASPRKGKAAAPFIPSHQRGGRYAMPTIRQQKGVTGLAAGFIVVRCALVLTRRTNMPRKVSRPLQRLKGPSRRPREEEREPLDSGRRPSCGSCIFMQDLIAKLAWARR
eukprot:s1179_g30.t2